MGRNGYPIISKRLYDLFVSLEPDVDKFVPVELLAKGGEPFSGGPYYFFFCMRYIDATILRLSNLKIREYPYEVNGKKGTRTSMRYVYTFNPELQHNEVDVSLSAQRIKGLHIWKNAFQVSGKLYFYISDELAGKMRQLKIDISHNTKLKEVDEPWVPEENLLNDQRVEFCDRIAGVLPDPNIGEDTEEPLRWLMM